MGKTEEKKRKGWINILPRDRELFLSIYEHEGFLTFHQIVDMSFPSERVARDRLRKLHHFGFLGKSDALLRAACGGEVLYWLTDNSIALVAKELKKSLTKSFKWVRRPHSSKAPHTIRINNVRVRVEEDCKRSKFLAVSEWIADQEFHESGDRVTYKNGGKEVTRKVEPDGFFVITNRTTERNTHYLFELLRKADNRAVIIDEKILPGLHYFASPAYKRRTAGSTDGEWIYVVDSPNAALRVKNLKSSVEYELGEYAARFYFTTYETFLNSKSVVLDPIWHRGGSERLWSLIDPAKAPS